VKTVLLTSLGLCFLMGGGGAVAATIEQPRLAWVFAPLALAFGGIAVITGMAMSARDFGEVNVIVAGRVNRRERPCLYWALWALPMLWGVAMLGLGVWLLSR
jgi:hypothetical protein